MVADPPAPNVVVHKSAESNAVNKVWHESYGSTTVTQPQVNVQTLKFSEKHTRNAKIQTEIILQQIQFQNVLFQM